MNANSISRPVSQQSAHSWTPLLAAVLLAIALVIGAAGVAALTAKSSSTSPMVVPKTLTDHPAKDLIAPPLSPMFVPKTLTDHPAKDLIVPLAPVAPFVPESVNIHEHMATPLVPQSINSHEHQVQRFDAPGMGGR